MTTRTLVLLRHGKSEHPSGVADFERALTERGQQDARAAGRWLSAQELVPELVICSSARRARQTWKAAAETAGGAPQVQYERDVYEASHPNDLLELIHVAPPDVGVLLLVGHNPTFEMLSAILDPTGGFPDGLRTAGIAVHQLTGNWPEVTPGTAPRTKTATPRN